jgi:serine/threonine protein kinase
MRAGLKLSGRYVLEELLGRGGMGEVWRGVDEQLDRSVAVKVLREYFADPELGERFRREARIAARLQHPGITVVHDVGSDNGHLFIVMELLHGCDLAAILSEAPGGLPIDAAVALTVQAADALQAAHAGHVVHRDLKPANLFVLDGGQLKICDFGIARAIDATTHLTAVGQAIGTPAYMSPEQCLGQQVDERSDLYSLGCVLYELLTGQPPFAEGPPLAIMSQHLNTTPTAPRMIRPDVPSGIDDFVLELLAKNPAHRPAGAGDVIAALRALRYTPTVKIEPTAKAPPRRDLTQSGPPGNAASFQPIGSDRTVSAIPARLPSAQPARSAAVTRVPRTEAERRQVLLARPVYWEFLYFAGQLLHERDSGAAKYRDYCELRYPPAGRGVVIGRDVFGRAGQRDDLDKIADYISRRFKRAANLGQKMSDIIKDKAHLERAFGGTSQDGDPEKIAHLAKHWNSAYEEFLDWTASLQGASVPSEFGNLLVLAARYSDEPVKKYRRFVNEYAAQVDAIYDRAPEAITIGKSIEFEVKFTLSRREEVIKDYEAELNRLRNHFYRGGL